MQNHNNQRLHLSLVVFLLIVIFAGYGTIDSAIAEGNALLWLNPASATIPQGQMTDIVVQLDDVDNMYGIEMHLTFDPAMVSVVDADTGKESVQIQPGSCPQEDFPVTNVADNAVGTIDYGVTQLNPTPPCSGGDVATITFECQAAGQSDITFDSSIISDPDGLEIAHNTQASTIICEVTSPPPADFDGDRMSDPAKFYSETGTVWWLASSTGSWDGMWLGGDTFDYVTGDFDGDGMTDPAKFYSGTGTVWWVESSTGTMDGQWLGADSFAYISDSDFDGDGKTDPAKFYSGTGTVWWVESSTGTLDGMWLGGDTFTYVPGSDFDGDGKTDPAKFYEGTGTVWWLESSTGTMDGAWLGGDTFSYVPRSDFDGDGKTDPAKFYDSTGTLWWMASSTGIMEGVWLGPAGTFTVVGG